MKENNLIDSYAELERGVYAALETYCNVHRGSGHNSQVTTHIYEQARDIILEYLCLRKDQYIVIFCNPRRASILEELLKSENYQCISSDHIGLPIGVKALALNKRALPRGIPFQSGGGTAKLISYDWVIWADAPDRYEAGTPSIINIIAFARALQMVKQYGKDIFKNLSVDNITPAQIIYHDELEKYSGSELLDELRKRLIGRGICVPTSEGMKPLINLDNSASTRTFIPVWDAYCKVWRQPLQQYQKIIQEVRSVCSQLFNASSDIYDIVFTSNTTEAINLVAESLGHEPEQNTGSVILNTLLEHSSNDLPWRTVPNHSLIRLQVDDDGFVDINELETLFRMINLKGQYGNKRIKLVALCGASNVLGVCNNLEEISRVVHKYGARLLVDAAQLVAHRKVDITGCGIDYLAFSAHKLYAPFGCGVLIVKKELLQFNTVEMKLIKSSGEENVAGIAALGKALVLLQRIGMGLIQQEEKLLTVQMLQGLARIDGIKIFGIKNPELPAFEQKIGVIVFSLPNMMPNKVAKELAFRGGIGVRYGCHCAHIIIKHILHVSPFLEKFQRLMQIMFPKLRLPGLVRVSLGLENSAEEVEKFMHILYQIAGMDHLYKDIKIDTVNDKKAILPEAEVKQQINDFVKASSKRIYF